MPRREHANIDIDSNDDTFTSDEVRVQGSCVISAYINDDTGTHTNCVVRLQISPNGVGANWYNVGDPLSGNRDTTTVTAAAKFARFKVTTAEGSTSTYKGFILAE